MTEKHYQILENIVKDLNSQGRSLKLYNDHDKDEFVILRIREVDHRNILGLKIPKKGGVVYETPVRSRGTYGYTNDQDIIKALENTYGDSFKIIPLS